MSNLELSQNKNIYQIDVVLVGGTVNVASNAVFLANFFSNTSKVIGVVRKTSSGTPAQPSLFISRSNQQPPVLTAVLNSAAADTSTYTILWINEVASDYSYRDSAGALVSVPVLNV
jgi:hypothetical protein